MKKILSSALLAMILISSLTPINALLQLTNDNHEDSDDYCLTAYDISINLSEMKDITQEELEKKIYETSNPQILIRDTWQEIDPSLIQVDYSQLEQKENLTTGYEIKITVPKINEENDSTISFHVFVKNDYATISFENTDLLEKQIKIGSVIDINQINSPTKQGYQFMGWYLDEACTSPFLLLNNSSYNQQTITESLKLYPLFQKNKEEPVKPQISKNNNSSNKISTQKKEQPEAEPQTEEQPIEEQTKEKISSSIKAETKTSKKEESKKAVNKQRKEMVSIPKLVVISSLSVIALGLSISVISDLRVLAWYNGKKH